MSDDAPATGRDLYLWIKLQEQRHRVRLLAYLNSWARLQDGHWPRLMTDWSEAQVRAAYDQAVRKLGGRER
jgi:hypothetical protein